MCPEYSEPVYVQSALFTAAEDHRHLSLGCGYYPESQNKDGAGLSAQAIYLVVTECARELGLVLAPHDARRTFDKLAHKGHVPLEQIQLSLGHDSILTTEKYLGVRQDLTDAPCNYLGLDLS